MCGAAAASKETVVVPDVLKFPGHIACDAESRSEIVVPILVRGEVSLSLVIVSFTYWSCADDSFAGCCHYRH